MVYNIFDYSPETKLILENFEVDLKQKISSVIKPDAPWKCIFKLSLTEKKENEPNSLTTSNASFSLKDSYVVYNAAQDTFKKGLESISKYLKPHHSLKLELTFVELSDEEKYNRSMKSTFTETTKKDDNDGEGTFLPQTPLYTFDKVILAEEIKKEIISAINILKYQDLIYNQWGFIEVDPVPKSVLNFYGPPGTGKTMSAHGIAHELNKPLLALNYAEIESKYVGEAPKNLVKAFTVAKKYDAVLFFDEADSFLGKRIQNVTQGAEQALNSLRSQMLMLLEQHPGVIIFATNLVTNFDSAFESRILKHIKFELPNKEARTIIIKNMLPSRLPWSNGIGEDEIEDMAEIAEGLSGREIKGVVLETLLTKVSEEGENTVFSGNDFVKRFEHKKQEKKRLKEEADAKLKQKITNALNRQLTPSQDSDSPSDSEIHNTEKG